MNPKARSSAASDLLFRLGGSLMVIGMVLSLIALTPLVADFQLSSVWWGLSMITGVGLVLVLVGLRRNSSARTRAVQTWRDSQN